MSSLPRPHDPPTRRTHFATPGDGPRAIEPRAWLPRRLAWPLVFALVAAIALADYDTGYEVRLAILYLVPATIATWILGRAAGFFVVALAIACWLAAFASNNMSSHAVYFVWEAVTMAIGFAVIVELIARLRAALARSDARFLRVLEELFDAVYVADDRTGAILYANRRLGSIVGSDPVRMPSHAVESLFVADRWRRTEAGPDVAAMQPPFEIEEVCDSRTNRWYLRQSGPIPWPGRSGATLRVFTDITPQKEAELEKTRQEETAQRMSRLVALGEVAANLTHELNQPLAAITGYSNAGLQLLEVPDADLGSVRLSLEGCRDEAVRAGRIVNRMRDFVRRRSESRRPCNLDDIVGEAVQLLRSQLRAAEIRVEVRAAETLPQVPADRLMIVQVLINLIQNAIEAMRGLPVDRRQLVITTSRSVSGGARVAVADRGPGVPVVLRERLFEAFCTTKPEGLGLGLSICASVIAAHSGRLWHAPGAECGTEFAFELPGAAA